MEADDGIDLRVELAGISLKNPFLVCSGTFGNGREMSELVDLNALGGLMTKAVTLEPCPGNPPPRLWETPSGMLNSIGLENKGLERFLAEDLPWLSRFDVPVWVNVAGFSAREYVEVAEAVSRSGLAAAVELNISCPNVEKGGAYFSRRPREAAELVARVREVVDIPLFVKLPPLPGAMRETALAVAEAGADGLSLINTLPAMAVDVERCRPRLGNVTGGLSGPAIHPVAVHAVWEASGAVDLPVIGMGGIWSCSDAVEMLMAGAAAVAVGTLNLVDPRAVPRLAEELAGFMRWKGYRRVPDMVGLLRRRGWG
ncbi:dihydroorotate dehydrogenase [Candidatus Solincola tengchongensis]|uniref:dihydroorotate dehydrogenase n=1 Tax=Candidatus Solincola tengchongensis TaxID=2900693 RepID=UPI00257CB07A|nr:dihydroorotate dehydrogenase [Candidatus Solincola tengchongensis]